MSGDPSRVIGVFICPESLDMGVSIPGSELALRIAFTPEEMRGFAKDLLAAADERERRAAQEATALLERVTGRMQ